MRDRLPLNCVIIYFVFILQAMAQQQHELQRRLAEANKELMHEELLRKSVQKAVGEAVEVERQRRIKVLREMAEGKGDSTYEIADTNAKLSKVHTELKQTFQYIWVCIDTSIPLIHIFSRSCSYISLSSYSFFRSIV